MVQMDTKKLWSILPLLLISIGLFAAEVTGKVIDAGTKQPIDFANVSAMQGETLVTGMVTDEKGEFKLELADGKYTLAVSFM